MSGQVILLISGFLGVWGVLAIVNPTKYGDNAIATLSGLVKTGESVAGSTTEKAETTNIIGEVHGDVYQNINSKKGKITPSKKASYTVIDGEHSAKGNGDITAIDVEDEPVFFKPGTKSTAEGKGSVTATRIRKKGPKE